MYLVLNFYLFIFIYLFSNKPNILLRKMNLKIKLFLLRMCETAFLKYCKKWNLPYFTSFATFIFS